MTRHDSILGELGPAADPERDADLDPIADRLTASRPVPAPALRSKIRARYSTEAGRTGPAQSARFQILAYGVTGLALIALAAVGLAGVGPLS